MESKKLLVWLEVDGVWQLFELVKEDETETAIIFYAKGIDKAATN